MRLIIPSILCLIIGLAGMAQATETYDLIFKNGTLEDIAKDETITYARDVTINANAESAQANTGLIELSFADDDMAHLKFLQGEKHKAIGQFPASVGNPMIMYFVETVVRDMAENAGGSPFYIRNRVKDSLVKFAEIESQMVQIDGVDVQAQKITLRPFLNDKNKDRMKGYGDMALTITMSEDIPGWYYALVASVKGTGNAPIYENAVTFSDGPK